MKALPLTEPPPPLSSPAPLWPSRPPALEETRHTRFSAAISVYRRDLALGILVSLLFHAGLLFSELLFPSPQPKRVVRPAEPPAIQFELPPIEPELPDTPEEIRDEPAPGDVAAPTLADIPSVIPIDAFVQPLQAPAVSTNLGQGIRIILPVLPGAGSGHGLGRIFDLDSLDQPPTARNKVQPAYPPELLRSDVSGEVEVEFVVDARGQVVALSILRSSHAAFEQPVMTAVGNWTFKPGRKAGRDVNSRVRQTITFTPAIR